MSCHGQHDETACGDCAIWWHREAERLREALVRVVNAGGRWHCDCTDTISCPMAYARAALSAEKPAEKEKKP